MKIIIDDKPVEVKPCPFCGSDDLHVIHKPSPDKTITWNIFVHPATSHCSASMEAGSLQELVDLWNSRK